MHIFISLLLHYTCNVYYLSTVIITCQYGKDRSYQNLQIQITILDKRPGFEASGAYALLSTYRPPSSCIFICVIEVEAKQSILIRFNRNVIQENTPPI